MAMTASDKQLMKAAGGDKEKACRLLWSYSEGFDGEWVIGLQCELAMRRRIGAPVTECKRKLAHAQAEEDQMIADYLARRSA